MWSIHLCQIAINTAWVRDELFECPDQIAVEHVLFHILNLNRLHPGTQIKGTKIC